MPTKVGKESKSHSTKVEKKKEENTNKGVKEKAGGNYHPAPDVLPAFPNAKLVKFKTSIQGGGGKRKRWKNKKGNIIEWDSQHGTVEIYDKQGKHKGEYDPNTGEQTKSAKKGRKVEK